jgi:(S)-2-hydroxyglutarate dehydrogenase
MHNFAIIGAGIVGLSTARQLQIRHPDKKILLLEKEDRVARHQTGRNSGVIHSGIYYAPGSLKARFCNEGVEATIAFCEKHGISYEQCGKLIVATDEAEHERLLDLFERARLNELDVELIDGAELKHIEPEITGISAIRLKTTGIVSYAAISEKLAEEFRAAGGEIQFGLAVTNLTETATRIDIEMETGKTLQCRHLIVCGGLMADRLTRMLNMNIDFRIIPYRGEYYQLPPERNDIVKHLIYPVPDPALPFLGVHLTKMIDGSVTVGPSALQGWKREGYGLFNLNVRDTWEQLTFSGFWRISYRFFRTGLKEIRNAFWKPSYLKLVHKYCPSIRMGELQPYPVGVRAMAVRSDGTMISDFLFAETDRSLHVCNAPSPAATSAFPIGNYICDKIDEKVGND